MILLGTMILISANKLVLRQMHTLILKLLIDIVLLIVHNLLSNLLPILQQNFAYQDVQHFPVYMDKGKILDV